MNQTERTTSVSRAGTRAQWSPRTGAPVASTAAMAFYVMNVARDR